MGPRIDLALDVLFTSAERDEAARLLKEDCSAATVPGASGNESEIERIRLAALKCSGGSLEKLYAAIALAQTDYRDLLMAAGFGWDVAAHQEWDPEEDI